MRWQRVAGLVVLAGCASGGLSREPPAPHLTAPQTSRFEFPAPDSASVFHLLNRLTFGPRPGDIAHVQQLGFAPWFEEQLHPGRIRDTIQDAVRRQHTIAFEPPDELWRQFPPPQLARQLAGRSDGPRRIRADPQPGMERSADRPPASDSMLIQRTQGGMRRMDAEFVMATLERHVASERQLEEVMTDFWFNHFNVFMGKNADRWLIGDYVERAIRPHALGRFEDLLRAVAQHPAMLVYLDNFQSVASGSRPPGFGRAGFRRPLPPQAQQRIPTGINENYARELLELHTLGVDGGYTQADVENVARILTGWSVSAPARGRFEFEFRPWAHDIGEKVVLGQLFSRGHFEDEGLRLLAMLARHPATARHLAHKLCQRFVADTAPDGCVDRAASTYLATRGDIAAVVRAIVTSDDFWASQNRRNKVKSPLEFLVSALRAAGAAPDTTPRLSFVLQQLGQPLFMQQVPTGYPETEEQWVNSGALLDRMNTALALAAGRLPGIEPAADTVIPAMNDRDSLVARVNAVILGGQGTAHTLQVIREQITDLEPRMARAMAVGLALGSPDFQRQ